MNSPALRRLAFALLLSIPVLWLIGPRWPGGYDRLLCGETWSARATFPDRPTCETAMRSATEACVCEDVRGSWSPFYYLVLFPLIAVHGLLFMWPRTIRGVVAVMAVIVVVILVVPWTVFFMYAAHLHIPRLMQSMAIAWPQIVLFPAVLEIGTVKVIPWVVSDWALTISIATWAVLGLPFGAATQRLRSPAVLTGLAVAYVAAIAIALFVIAPRFGGKYLLEFP
jgi:hypothetical protein